MDYQPNRQIVEEPTVSVPIELKLTRTEISAFAAAAERAGLTTSAWAHRVLRAAAGLVSGRGHGIPPD